ncbi:MAG: DNA-binding protein [Myxococcales bacterium]|nr:DNA-binding protein [Myxococcales bacterium]
MTTALWASVEDVASHLGVAKDSVYRWAGSRQRRAHEVGRLWKLKPCGVGEGGEPAAPARRTSRRTG